MANITNIENISAEQAWDVPVVIHRTGARPLDNASYFMSLDKAQEYASSGKTSYVSQELYVVNKDLSSVDVYVIQDTAGTLVKLTDNRERIELSNAISGIIDDVAGHMNYRGHVNTIRHLGNEGPHIDGLSVAFLLANFYDKDGQVLWNIKPEDGTPYFISSFALHNGWAYNIKLADDWPIGAQSYTTPDGVRFDNNDYILIHSHLSNGVEISALKPSDIDIIKNYDLSVRFLQSQIISNDNDIAFLSSVLSDTVLSVEDISAHYFNTLSSIDRGRDNTIRTDNLMVTDISGEAGTRQKYYMTFKYGTLVLEKIR